MKRKIFVAGMSCGHCVNHVKEALSELTGATKADADLDSKTAVLESSGEVKDEDIKYAIEEAGYEVVEIELLEK